MSVLLARRNLLGDRTRFLLSVLGVAIPVMLILLLAGYRAGVYRQATAYLDNTPGSVVVAEHGIRDFLGTSSVLPARAMTDVSAVDGVKRVIPVISQFVVFERHGRKDGFFLVGYDPTAGGGPWKLVEGREPTGNDEIVLDRTTARQHGMALGDELTVLDRELLVVGFSDETTFWAGSIAFARTATLESLLRTPGLRTFLIVTPEDGLSAGALRDRLHVEGTDAVLKVEVAMNDRALLARVYDSPILLMVVIAFVVGMLVVGLVIYTATMERRREYGAVKALGAGSHVLSQVVIVQAIIAGGAGVLVGAVLSAGAATALMTWRPQFQIDVDTGALAAVAAAGLVMSFLAAVLPARTIARLQPAEVFRR